MQLLTKNLPKSHNLFFAGDVHTGSSLSTQEGWDKLVEMLNSEYQGCADNYILDMGDEIEAVLVDDKRFSPERLTEPLPLEQQKTAISMREPIKHRMLCMLLGNHTRKLWRFGDLTKDTCEKLGIDYGTYTAKISIRDLEGKFMYKVYATHGFKNITSTADDPKRRQVNMELILKRHLKFQAADCAIMVKGHTHKLLVCKPETELYLTDDGRKVKQGYTKWEQEDKYIHPDARWYGNSGSFLKLFGKGISGYGEIMELNPVPLGFLILRVRDKQIVSLDPIYLDL